MKLDLIQPMRATLHESLSPRHRSHHAMCRPGLSNQLVDDPSYLIFSNPRTERQFQHHVAFFRSLRQSFTRMFDRLILLEWQAAQHFLIALHNKRYCLKTIKPVVVSQKIV